MNNNKKQNLYTPQSPKTKPNISPLDSPYSKEQLLAQIKELQLQLVQKEQYDSADNNLSSRSNASNRVIVVANRLPISLTKDEKTGEYTSSISSGGLVSALKGVQGMDMVWLGWPGKEIPNRDQAKVQKVATEQGCKCIFLSDELIENYYNGYSNSILWPLFHYIQTPIDEWTKTMEKYYDAYKEANEKFAEAVLNVYEPGDLIWVHDYHLMLLPNIIRSKKPLAKIGWFLHVPFPSSEIYRLLPQRNALLNGILASDLVGFHTFDYARHFKSSCTRILGLESTYEGVDCNGRIALVGTYPIGIETDRFTRALDSEAVAKHYDELERKFAGRKVVLGLDRLDYVKGIPHKAYILDRFLRDNPHWIGKVVLVQLGIPSREVVPMYVRLKRDTHQLVGEVNGRYGTLDSVPIHYLDQRIAFEKMCALYRLADVCLVTSLRDGMNLVSMEYIACQYEKSTPGVLVISEYAGAAQSLGAGAIRINPWDTVGAAKALRDALELGIEERREYHQYLFQHISEHTAQKWAQSFTTDAHIASRRRPQSILTVVPPPIDKQMVESRFKQAKKRVIILGLVGTLTQARMRGVTYQMFERVARIDPQTYDLVKKLSSDPNTTVIVMTSRGKSLVTKLLGDTDCWLIPENGFFIKEGHKSQWQTLVDNIDLDWFDNIRTVLTHFVERTPRSFIEEQETYMSFHYRDSDTEWARTQANDLVTHLTNNPVQYHDFETVHGSRLVQVRPIGVSKGAAAERCIQELEGRDGKKVDYVLCVGNFLFRDEDLFSTLEANRCSDDTSPILKARHIGRRHSNDRNSPTPKNKKKKDCDVFCCTVGGHKPSRAAYHIPDISGVRKLLTKLCNSLDETNHVEGKK